MFGWLLAAWLLGYLLTDRLLAGLLAAWLARWLAGWLPISLPEYRRLKSPYVKRIFSTSRERTRIVFVSETMVGLDSLCLIKIEISLCETKFFLRPAKQQEFSLSEKPWLAWILSVWCKLKSPYMKPNFFYVPRKDKNSLYLTSLGWPRFSLFGRAWNLPTWHRNFPTSSERTRILSVWKALAGLDSVCLEELQISLRGTEISLCQAKGQELFLSEKHWLACILSVWEELEISLLYLHANPATTTQNKGAHTLFIEILQHETKFTLRVSFSWLQISQLWQQDPFSKEVQHRYNKPYLASINNINCCGNIWSCDIWRIRWKL